MYIIGNEMLHTEHLKYVGFILKLLRKRQNTIPAVDNRANPYFRLMTEYSASNRVETAISKHLANEEEGKQ